MSAPATPQEFVQKWRRIELKERSAAQAHFRDLCSVLGQPKKWRRIFGQSSK